MKSPVSRIWMRAVTSRSCSSAFALIFATFFGSERSNHGVKLSGIRILNFASIGFRRYFSAKYPVKPGVVPYVAMKNVYLLRISRFRRNTSTRSGRPFAYVGDIMPRISVSEKRSFLCFRQSIYEVACIKIAWKRRAVPAFST